METLETLGGETWFRLGDRDLAVHVERTRRLRAGETLSAITADLCRRLGVGAARAADERRSGAHAGAHRRGLDRLPGLFRAPALRAGGARTGIPRRRDGARASGFPGRADRSGAEGGGDLPVQSVHQHRADPGGARRARGAGRLRGAGDRGLADHRRTRGQGTDGEDDDGARHRPRAPARWRIATTTCSTATSSITPTWTRSRRSAPRVTLAQTMMTTLADREALARTVLGARRRAAARLDDHRWSLGGGAGEGIHRREAAPRPLLTPAAAPGAGGGDAGGRAGGAGRRTPLAGIMVNTRRSGRDRTGAALRRARGDRRCARRPHRRGRRRWRAF